MERAMTDALVQDVRYAVRQLRNNRGFTIVALVTLALGIGANTAIFSIVQGVVLTRLPYFQSDRLVMIWESNPRFPRVWNSYPNFQDWKRTARSFQQIAAFRKQGVDLNFPGGPSHIIASQITSGFFSTLGTPLTLGRELDSQADQSGGTPEVIISDRLWNERFGGIPTALGTTITLDGVSYVIVGVAPRRFRLNIDADVFLPLAQIDPLVLNNRGSHDGIYTVARLKPGVTIDRGQAEMTSIQSHLDELYPTDNHDLGIHIEPLKEAIVGDTSRTLALLLGAVNLVLLIVSANIASLLLARSAGRSREFAIRASLGAKQLRLARQLLTESVILAVAGGVCGSVIAFLGVKSASPTLSAVLPRGDQIGVNAPVLMYTLFVSVLVGILFGLAPALRIWRKDLQGQLKQGGRGLTVAHLRTQSSFVVAQVALTLVLLVGAGLLLRTLFHLWSVAPGFDTDEVMVLKVSVSHSLTKTPADMRVAYLRMVEAVRQVPGVQAAELTTAVPLSGQGGYLPFWLDSQRPESLQAAPRLGWVLTGSDYLRTMGMQLLKGRFVSEDDNTKSPCIVVIDSNFDRAFFKGREAIGHTITAGFAAFGPCTIVGIVNHVKYGGLIDTGGNNDYQAYYSLAQVPDRWVPVNYPDASLAVRTSLSATAIIPSITQAVRQVNSDQPIYNVQTMRQIVANSTTEQRFPTILLGAFAGLALFLAAVGVYGMISYSVAQRMQEIGIRMALGADKRRIIGLFISQELRLVMAGICVGIFATLVLGRTLGSFSNLLYGVGTADPLTFAAASVLLILVTLVGCLPARRATTIDPMIVLKHE
jgi:putative ABC transport system permease protein